MHPHPPPATRTRNCCVCTPTRIHLAQHAHTDACTLPSYSTAGAPHHRPGSVVFCLTCAWAPRPRSRSALGTGKYRVVTSGSCASAGLNPITLKVACGVAAQTLGLSDSTPTKTTSTSRPQGCSLSGGSMLYLATNSANEGNGADGLYRPICEAKPIQGKS